MRYTVATLLMMTFISACSSNKLKTGDIDKIQADCSNVDQTITILTQEKENNSNRIKAGIQSVVPFSAAVNIVSGNYKQNVSIATGEWGAKLDEKLAEMNRLKASCEAAR